MGKLVDYNIYFLKSEFWYCRSEDPSNPEGTGSVSLSTCLTEVGAQRLRIKEELCEN